MLNCAICGKRLPVWFKGECCPGNSSKCRKKKSRDRLMAPQRAHKVAFEIDALVRTIRITDMGAADARTILNTIWRSLDGMIDQVRELEAKVETKEG